MVIMFFVFGIKYYKPGVIPTQVHYRRCKVLIVQMLRSHHFIGSEAITLLAPMPYSEVHDAV